MATRTHAKRLRNYASSIFEAGDDSGGLEALEPASPRMEEAVRSLTSWSPWAAKKADLVASTLDDLRTGSELSAEQYCALEAIILPGKRPVAYIKHGKIQSLPQGEFSHLIDDATIRARLEGALASVGCVLIPNDPRYPYAGTGFVVGPGLVMTNRHVARLFADGVGTKRIAFLRGQPAQFTPGREVKSAGADPTFEVRRVVMIHPYWDMALLEIPDLPLPALSLAPLDPSEGQRLVAVVGYPAFDPRNPTDVQNQVFHKRFYVKRLAPGYVTGRRRVQSFGNIVNAGTHDASSLGGNSGSAVIDVETGHVIGLHFAGVYLDANFAVPAIDLWADPRVARAGALFTSTSPAPAPARALSSAAEARWREVESEEQVSAPLSVAASTTPQAASEGGVVRVTIPIEITVRVSEVAARGQSVDPPKGRG